jgi:hypothetical protein
VDTTVNSSFSFARGGYAEKAVLKAHAHGFEEVDSNREDDGEEARGCIAFRCARHPTLEEHKVV